MKNEDLKQIYDSQELNFHSGYNESQMIVKMLDSWQGLDVLEIGCGHGHLASILSYAGANVVGIDFSAEQTEAARDRYPNVDIRNWPMDRMFEYEKLLKFDVVVMQGVLEHLDEPWQELDKIMERLLGPQGICCLSVPHWVNPRGYIYHALRLLFDAKMSLTDLHYFVKGDFKRYCEAGLRAIKGTSEVTNDRMFSNYQCQFYHCDESWASGPEMIEDFRDRLPKALNGINKSYFEPKDLVSNEKVDTFLKFLEKMLPDIPKSEGACLGVKISK